MGKHPFLLAWVPVLCNWREVLPGRLAKTWRTQWVRLVQLLASVLILPNHWAEPAANSTSTLMADWRLALMSIYSAVSNPPGHLVKHQSNGYSKERSISILCKSETHSSYRSHTQAAPNTNWYSTHLCMLNVFNPIQKWEVQKLYFLFVHSDSFWLDNSLITTMFTAFYISLYKYGTSIN